MSKWLCIAMWTPSGDMENGRGAKEDHDKILCNQLATRKSSPIIRNTKVWRWYNECSSNVQPLGVVTETAWVLFACASHLEMGTSLKHCSLFLRKQLQMVHCKFHKLFDEVFRCRRSFSPLLCCDRCVKRQKAEFLELDF